jgi:ubiquinone/menaquinone biosynthesis C-methylase UbiE
MKYLIGKLSTKLFYKLKFAKLKKKFLRNLYSDSGFVKTTEDSKDIYEKYDDREQRDYVSRSRHCVYNGKVKKLPFKIIREKYLNYLYEELASVNPGRRPLRILEVGCGNCINLVNLSQRFKKEVELYGIDISTRRLEVARKFFKEDLAGVNLFEAARTQKTNWDNGYFAVVFSMHCLEQIAHETMAAVKEMYRLADRKLVMIEPVFELGNPAQKLYLYNSDHCRILLKTIHALGYKIARLEPLNIQSNPVNQSSIVVIEK